MPSTRDFPPDIDPEGRPSLSVNDERVEAWLGFEPAFTFRWLALEEVAVRIEPCLSEAWWDLKGGGQTFSAPVEIVYNAEALNQRLFALPVLTEQLMMPRVMRRQQVRSASLSVGASPRPNLAMQPTAGRAAF